MITSTTTLPPRASETPGARGGWAGLRPLLLRLHFYVGMFVGPFILIAALTGLAYTLTPQLEQVAHRDALTVVAGTDPVPLPQQVAAAQAALPSGATVTEIRPAATPTSTTRVTFASDDVGGSYARTAFVNPYTAEVTDVLTTFGEWLPVRAWIDTAHRTLFLGDVGRGYSELAASWLGVLAASGLVLWLVRHRRQRRLRTTLLPTGGRGRPRLRSWHGTVGLWAAVGLFFLSVTGLTWSQFAGQNVSTVRMAFDVATPSVDRTLPASSSAGSPAATTDVATTSERMVTVARSQGLRDPLAVSPPSEAGEAWMVSEVKRSWPVQQDSVSIDPSTEQVVDLIRFDDWPVAGKLAEWGVDAHMGLLFGVANQVALAALALGIVVLVVWGYRMWWLRRPRTGGVASHPAPAQAPGFGPVMVVTVAAIAVGVALPVLGASLLAFLVLDAVRLRVVEVLP